MRGERLELGEVGIVKAGGRVGVAPDRRVDLREVLGGRQRRATRRARGSDGHDPGHAGLRRTSHKLGVRRLAHVQMRVAVDH
jgi:hypothetical protein